MYITVIFDKRSSKYENDNFEFNKLFVKATLKYLIDRYKVTGYLYMNTLYEQLGLKWNACDENNCWVYNRDGELKIDISEDEKSGKIWIDITNEL